jgi:MSHA biogenesis protein MshP
MADAARSLGGRVGRRVAGLGSQRGFTLISTLFLLVIVASLGAYMVNLAATQHVSSALVAQHTRALYAALSGLEWAAYEIRSNPGACPPLPASFVAEGFTITLAACSRQVVTESGTGYALYDVTVDASRGSFGDHDFVSRSLRATLGE